MSNFTDLDLACANAIRTLTLDAVQKAKSGHPGMPLGMADVAWVLYKNFMRVNPADVTWFDRDRLIISAGHGSMLAYALLYLTGQPAMTLDELMQFRQVGSRTPGHPENHLTPGIEVTTGPLGAGTGNSAGMALAEAWLAARYNRASFPVVDHATYVIVSDGDLQEGVSHEAASLAGHLGLGKLVWFYDDNGISIDGPTSLSYSDNVPQRFEAYHWHVQTIDGHDMDAIEAAITAAHAVTDRPSIICCKTIIGKGMPKKQGTRLAHSDEPGEEELRGAKLAYGVDPDKTFFVPDEVLAAWRAVGARGAQLQHDWLVRLASYRAAHPEIAAEFEALVAGKLPQGWQEALPVFEPGGKPIATRAASGAVIDALIPRVPGLLGGSADLTPSNNTLPKGAESLRKGDLSGRYVRYGIREHAMTGMMNGMALHGGVIPYGGTFFTFSDYARPSLRLAALGGAHSIFVFTHDSIGVGEDGPTHQPVEHLAACRAIPGLTVIRPADANETALAWQVAIEASGPVALILSRQALPILPRNDAALRGAYIVRDAEDPQVLLVATGSEVSLALDAASVLAEKGLRARVVSMPSWELFDAQDAAYRESIFPILLPKVVVEAGVAQGWHRYTGPLVRFVTQERFGASGPARDVFTAMGFTVDRVVAEAVKVIG
ncbi:MAG TPA: transketolase [Thermoflexales bacterium]|nr:transketolase [Thermoflexales bacterium]HQY26074.1 transketolase [Thermoflexales bacterium]HQZ52814.1 transketolase [Thermoflexales bacterium]HRA55536.1 transketolase [Thermoflexales bacterium]